MAAVNELMDWLGDVFYVERTVTTHSEGYTSERYSYGSGTQLMELPYEDTTTVTQQELNWTAVAAFILVVLTFVTIVTTVKGALLK